MAEKSHREMRGLGLIIGESPIARLLFGDTKHRRMVKKLIGVLPIFDLNGKPATLSSELSADVIARARKAMVHQLAAARQRPNSRRPRKHERNRPP